MFFSFAFLSGNSCWFPIVTLTKFSSWVHANNNFCLFKCVVYHADHWSIFLFRFLPRILYTRLSRTLLRQLSSPWSILQFIRLYLKLIRRRSMVLLLILPLIARISPRLRLLFHLLPCFGLGGGSLNRHLLGQSRADERVPGHGDLRVEWWTVFPFLCDRFHSVGEVSGDFWLLDFGVLQDTVVWAAGGAEDWAEFYALALFGFDGLDLLLNFVLFVAWDLI